MYRCPWQEKGQEKGQGVMCFSKKLVTKEKDQDEQEFISFLTYQPSSLVLSLRLPWQA